MSSLNNLFTVNLKGGEIIRLWKGMTKNEVIILLGEPSKVLTCSKESNEKLIFKPSGLHYNSTYELLFTRLELVYVTRIH